MHLFDNEYAKEMMKKAGSFEIPLTYDLAWTEIVGPIVVRTVAGLEIIDLNDRHVPRNWVM